MPIFLRILIDYYKIEEDEDAIFWADNKQRRVFIRAIRDDIEIDIDSIDLKYNDDYNRLTLSPRYWWSVKWGAFLLKCNSNKKRRIGWVRAFLNNYAVCFCEYIKIFRDNMYVAHTTKLSTSIVEMSLPIHLVCYYIMFMWLIRSDRQKLLLCCYCLLNTLHSKDSKSKWHTQSRIIASHLSFHYGSGRAVADAVGVASWLSGFFFSLDKKKRRAAAEEPTSSWRRGLIMFSSPNMAIYYMTYTCRQAQDENWATFQNDRYNSR